MEYTKDALEMAEKFEGCELVAYKDPEGILTIGYGHTEGVYKGMSITLMQAENFLAKDLQRAAFYVNTFVKPELTQGEFNALVDFVFNLGCERFRSSSMLRLLNDKQFYLASLEFEKWDHAGGKVLAGLLARRKAEEREFDEQSAVAEVS